MLLTLYSCKALTSKFDNQTNTFYYVYELCRKTDKRSMPCQITRFRSKEYSHLKSIYIHKVMCVMLPVITLKSYSIYFPEAWLHQKSEFILETKNY